MAPYSYAQKGFSIEAGLLHDQPTNDSHDRPYHNMHGGFGYIGNFGYDFFERLGLEIGVMHTGHDYDLATIGNEIRGATADKTTFFVKVRGVAFKLKKLELVTAWGAGYFDLSGQHYYEVSGVTFVADESFSGWGLTGNVNLRYNFSPGLAVGFYAGVNSVNYHKYTITAYPPIPFSGRLPGGDSINLGITVFHRIGIPQL